MPARLNYFVGKGPSDWRTGLPVMGEVHHAGVYPGIDLVYYGNLRAAAEDPDFAAAEFNRAFVLMQYYGYLRRNPNDAPDSDFSGYQFWLGKLNEFDGNFVQAEMVKAFLASDEYRRRFGQ